jgi:patatin-like phospholipase/acyl hydrolase
MSSQKPLRLLALGKFLSPHCASWSLSNLAFYSDGGGFRGLSSLYILKGLMTRLDQQVDQAVQRPLLPCDFFDLIAGTSTGGIIAIMLGVLYMDVETCISKYINLGPRIFPEESIIKGNKLSKAVNFLAKKPRFKSESLEAAIQEMVEERLSTRSTAGRDTMMRFEAGQDGGPRCNV